jgi:N-acetyl-D-muramate 6-phosphate phosphatase
VSAWRAVLFDLDGTLIDSAPDLAGAVNELLKEHGRSEMAVSDLRPMVGAGARGMLGLAFGITPQDAEYEGLKNRFLDLYRERIVQETRVFEGVWELLDALEAQGLQWGIVTNKFSGLAELVTRGLGLRERTGVLIGGDTTGFAKPHPEPLLAAARHLGVPPEHCLYVGDDLRDIQAGRAAGIQTAAASWGYLGMGEAIDAWGADHLIHDLAQLHRLVFPAAP